MIAYGPLWRTMKRKNITGYALVKKHGLSSGTLYRLHQGKPITTTTIDDLCRILGCKPGNIIEYIPEEQEETKEPD